MPKIVDLTGQTFGFLEVLKKMDGVDTNGKKTYLCKCTLCGYELVVRGTNLTSGRASSCGCIHSIGECNITQLFKLHKIFFKKEYSFEDLKDKKKLRFDFAVLREGGELDYLIEFDGHQHEIPWDRWQDSWTFNKAIVNDNRKNQYCFYNNIPLIRIPSHRRHNITINMLRPETSKYLVF